MGLFGINGLSSNIVTEANTDLVNPLFPEAHCIERQGNFVLYNIKLA